MVIANDWRAGALQAQTDALWERLSGGARPVGEGSRTGLSDPDVRWTGETDHRPRAPGGALQVISDFQPSGDQPAAIDELERRVREGQSNVVLLGATGTGKSATTAWLVERLQRPDPGDRAQQDAGGPAGHRVP